MSLFSFFFVEELQNQTASTANSQGISAHDDVIEHLIGE